MDKAYRNMTNMTGCILQVIPEGLGWLSALYLFTILLILTSVLSYPLIKMGQQKKGFLITKWGIDTTLDTCIRVEENFMQSLYAFSFSW